MAPADYKTERQRRGTLKGVAALLGIHWTTLSRRESGVIELTTEMALAMRSLPLRKTKDSRKGTTKSSHMRGGLEVDSRSDNAAPHVGCDAVFVPVGLRPRKRFLKKVLHFIAPVLYSRHVQESATKQLNSPKT